MIFNSNKYEIEACVTVSYTSIHKVIILYSIHNFIKYLIPVFPTLLGIFMKHLIPVFTDLLSYTGIHIFIGYLYEASYTSIHSFIIEYRYSQLY